MNGSRVWVAVDKSNKRNGTPLNRLDVDCVNYVGNALIDVHHNEEHTFYRFGWMSLSFFFHISENLCHLIPHCLGDRFSLYSIHLSTHNFHFAINKTSSFSIPWDSAFIFPRQQVNEVPRRGNTTRTVCQPAVLSFNCWYCFSSAKHGV